MILSPILNDSFIKQAQSRNKFLINIIDSNYCIISMKNNIISLSLFIKMNRSQERICQINIYAVSSHIFFYLVSQHLSISQHLSLSHAFYIGKEMYKAELSIALQQVYIQS